MSKENDSIVACLLSGQDNEKLRNIKLCRGDADIADGAELLAEAHAAVMQKRLGSIKPSREAPRSAQPVVDVRALVAKM